MIKSTLPAIATAAAAIFFSGCACAQSWSPQKNVEIVVGSAPGGSNDKTGRSVEKLLNELKLVPTSVTVVNKPGGGGTIVNIGSFFDKLGVKPGMRVTVLGVDDTSFLSDLKDRGIEPDAKPRTGTDLILLAADAPADLRRLETLKKSLAPGGAIWVVTRKGKETTLKDVDVIAAGRKAGLADTKVCAFSQTHTALRFAQRKSS